jgi:hypothetical protein
MPVRLSFLIRRFLLASMLASAAAFPAFAQKAEPPDLYAQLSDDQSEEADEFAVDNAIATVFHESGHMLVSEFKLPVLGREEDAVDALAAILLLEANDDDFDNVARDFANVWFLSAGSNDNNDDLAFWDVHGLDEQRAYNTVCWMVGKDAEKFKDFADSIDFPKERAEQCPQEYANLLTSWNKVLEPYVAGEGEKTDFEIVYEPTSNPMLAYFRNKIKEAGVLETVRETFSGSYRLHDGIKLVAAECGQANAFWNPGERQMTLCYEDVLNSAMLDAQWYIDNPGDATNNADAAGNADDNSNADDSSDSADDSGGNSDDAADSGVNPPRSRLNPGD